MLPNATIGVNSNMINKQSAMYGFQGGINPNQFNRSSVVMQAKENGEDDVVSSGGTANTDGKENLLNKPMTQEEINKKNFKPAYAYFVLFLALIARIMV